VANHKKPREGLDIIGMSGDWLSNFWTSRKHRKFETNKRKKTNVPQFVQLSFNSGQPCGSPEKVHCNPHEITAKKVA